MLIERSLTSTQDPNESPFQKSKDPSHAEKFLMTYPMVKIIVIVDTHCLENGYFVWTGDSPEDYRACSLLEVSNILLPGPSCRPTPFHRSYVTVPPKGYSSTFPILRRRQTITTRV